MMPTTREFLGDSLIKELEGAGFSPQSINAFAKNEYRQRKAAQEEDQRRLLYRADDMKLDGKIREALLSGDINEQEAKNAQKFEEFGAKKHGWTLGAAKTVTGIANTVERVGDFINPFYEGKRDKDGNYIYQNGLEKSLRPKIKNVEKMRDDYEKATGETSWGSRLSEIGTELVGDPINFVGGVGLLSKGSKLAQFGKKTLYFAGTGAASGGVAALGEGKNDEETLKNIGAGAVGGALLGHAIDQGIQGISKLIAKRQASRMANEADAIDGAENSEFLGGERAPINTTEITTRKDELGSSAEIMTAREFATKEVGLDEDTATNVLKEAMQGKEKSEFIDADSYNDIVKFKNFEIQREYAKAYGEKIQTAQTSINNAREQSAIRYADTQKAINEYQKQGMSASAIRELINAKFKPSADEIDYTRAYNDGSDVDARLTGQGIFYALEKDIAAYIYTPEQYFARLKSKGYGDEQATEFTRTYVQKDIDIAKEYVNEKVANAYESRVQREVADEINAKNEVEDVGLAVQDGEAIDKPEIYEGNSIMDFSSKIDDNFLRENATELEPSGNLFDFLAKTKNNPSRDKILNHFADKAGEGDSRLLEHRMAYLNYIMPTIKEPLIKIFRSDGRISNIKPFVFTDANSKTKNVNFLSIVTDKDGNIDFITAYALKDKSQLRSEIKKGIKVEVRRGLARTFDPHSRIQVPNATKNIIPQKGNLINEEAKNSALPNGVSGIGDNASRTGGRQGGDEEILRQSGRNTADASEEKWTAKSDRQMEQRPAFKGDGDTDAAASSKQMVEKQGRDDNEIRGDGFVVKNGGKLTFMDEAKFELSKELQGKSDLGEKISTSLAWLHSKHPEMFENKRAVKELIDYVLDEPNTIKAGKSENSVYLGKKDGTKIKDIVVNKSENKIIHANRRRMSTDEIKADGKDAHIPLHTDTMPAGATGANARSSADESIIPQKEINAKTINANSHIASGLVGGTLNSIDEDGSFNPEKFAAGFIAGLAGSKAVAIAARKITPQLYNKILGAAKKMPQMAKDNPKLLGKLYANGKDVSLNSFAGEKAITANVGKLDQAKAMLEKGADEVEIWQKTGWFKDKDEAWKFEIGDSKARLNPNFKSGGKLGELLEHEELFKAYPELKDISVKKIGDDIPDGAALSVKNTAQKEKRGIYNVAYNDKSATLVRRDLEKIDDALMFEKGSSKKGGAIHIKKHLEPEAQGAITKSELLNIGKNIREYLQKYKEPFIDEHGGRIYEWANKEGEKFRVVVYEKTDGISASHPETIISFYSNRNLKKPMEFRNPEVKYDVNLRQWHKDSAPITKNADGSPKVFYHGSSAKNLRRFDDKFDNYGIGWWFSSDEKVAKRFSDNIIPAYLKSNRLLDFSTPNAMDKRMLELIAEHFKDYDLSKIRKNDNRRMFGELIDKPHKATRFKEFLQASGYDGVRVNHDTIIVFKSNQIKHVKNNGNFSDNPNIYKSDDIGYYDPRKKEIALSDLGDKSTLMHEVQHAIQDIEGFARGGEYDIVWNAAVRTIEKKYENELAKLEKIANEAWKKEEPLQKAYIELFDKGLKDSPEAQRLLKEREPYSKKGWEARNKIRNIKWAIEDEKNAITDKDMYEAYQKIHGEVEARNVQNRLNLDDAAGTHPYETFDINPNETFVSREDGISFSVKDALQKERRGVYNVAFNEKKSTIIRKDLDAIDEIIKFEKGEADYVVNGERKSGYGALHIKKHLDTQNNGWVSKQEYLDMGQMLRKSTMQEADDKRIYTYFNDDGVRFRVVVGTGKNKERIISFYSNRKPLKAGLSYDSQNYNGNLPLNGDKVGIDNDSLTYNYADSVQGSAAKSPIEHSSDGKGIIPQNEEKIYHSRKIEEIKQEHPNVEKELDESIAAMRKESFNDVNFKDDLISKINAKDITTKQLGKSVDLSDKQLAVLKNDIKNADFKVISDSKIYFDKMGRDGDKKRFFIDIAEDGKVRVDGYSKKGIDTIPVRQSALEELAGVGDRARLKNMSFEVKAAYFNELDPIKKEAILKTAELNKLKKAAQSGDKVAVAKFEEFKARNLDENGNIKDGLSLC